MLARLAPALLLLAAAKAQGETPSVVTFISISPVPTPDGVLTIQTSVPVFSSSACYEVCIQAPCPPCAHTVTSEGSMGIPPGETPLPSALPSASISASPVPLPLPLSSGSPSASAGPSPSSSRTPPAEVSTAAASSSSPFQRDRAPFTLAVAVSGLALVGAAFMVL